MQPESEHLLREYSAGKISWSILRERGLENYQDVLTGLGELGLRLPIAHLEGPNRETRERGRAWIRQTLESHHEQNAGFDRH